MPREVASLVAAAGTVRASTVRFFVRSLCKRALGPPRARSGCWITQQAAPSAGLAGSVGL